MSSPTSELASALSIRVLLGLVRELLAVRDFGPWLARVLWEKLLAVEPYTLMEFDTGGEVIEPEHLVGRVESGAFGKSLQLVLSGLLGGQVTQ